MFIISLYTITLAGTMGDDGDLQVSVTWSSSRFTNKGDGTMTDNLTGGWQSVNRAQLRLMNGLSGPLQGYFDQVLP